MSVRPPERAPASADRDAPWICGVLLAVALAGTLVTGLALPAPDLVTWCVIALVWFVGALITDTTWWDPHRQRHYHPWPSRAAKRDLYIDNSQS